MALLSLKVMRNRENCPTKQTVFCIVILIFLKVKAILFHFSLKEVKRFVVWETLPYCHNSTDNHFISVKIFLVNGYGKV